MVNNHKETTSDVEPKKSYEKSHKLKMGSFPQRKKLLSNPPIKKNRYTKKLDSNINKSIPRIKNRERQELQGNSL